MIKYVDLQYLYPYVCKSNNYPVGHPRGFIRPNIRGLDANSYKGLIKSNVLPPGCLRIPLLPCHINGKLMFVLCRACAETTNCSHTCSKRCLTGTWVSLDLQNVVATGYVIVAIYEAWKYDEWMVYDQATSEGGLLSQYMHTFMKIKRETSGYPVVCTTP